jgi:hypothetical protein
MCGRCDWLCADTVAAGHTGNIARARSLVEVALRAYVEDWRDLSVDQGGDD